MDLIPVANVTTGEEDAQVVYDVVKSGWISKGKKVDEFEAKFAAEVGAKEALAVNNGTSALHVVLAALDIGPGDEVIVPPFTFIATSEAIALLGATPIFVDIDQKTFNLDPEKLNVAIENYRAGQQTALGIPGDLKLKGIIPVDLFGLPADYEAINAIARENSLFVLEDAAQSFGASYKGKMACNLKVVVEDGSQITYLRALGRHFAKWISSMILAIGFIMAAFDDEKRTLHDRICETRVVRK